jgi:hypothetical protein
MILRAERRTMFRTQPFSDAPITVYGATTGEIHVIQREDPVDPVTAAVRVTALSATGDTAWSIAIPYAPVELAQSRIDTVKSALLAGLGPIFPRDVIERALYVPRHRAPISEALSGVDRTLWLQWDAHTRPGVYSVIDANGRHVAEVRTPRGVRLRWVSGDVAWGELLDDNDVPSLVRYRLRTTGG